MQNSRIVQDGAELNSLKKLNFSNGIAKWGRAKSTLQHLREKDLKEDLADTNDKGVIVSLFASIVIINNSTYIVNWLYPFVSPLDPSFIFSLSLILSYFISITSEIDWLLFSTGKPQTFPSVFPFPFHTNLLAVKARQTLINAETPLTKA